MSRSMGSQPTSASGDTVTCTKEVVCDLLPLNDEMKNPCETLRCALIYIRRENREAILQGIGLLVQISRMHPDLLEPHMCRVNQSVCQQLNSTNTYAVRYACQAAKELFKTMQNTARPEFDEIVNRLLNRTADSNKLIRFDANSALDYMAIFISPINSVRALVREGPSHKNPLVRTTTSRLLVCITMNIGVDMLFTTPIYNETRKRLFKAAAKMVNDTNSATRETVKTLFEMFIKDDHFEDLFYNEVDRELLKKVHTSLTFLRYNHKVNI